MYSTMVDVLSEARVTLVTDSEIKDADFDLVSCSAIRMDPLFIATPPEVDVARALRMWPELAVRRIRPLFISTLGDTYVETNEGEVLVVDPMGLECSHVADSVGHLERLFSDPSWAEERLATELLLLAHERGINRSHHQVFGVAPHPCLSGKLAVENLIAMDVHVWHHILRTTSREPNKPFRVRARKRAHLRGGVLRAHVIVF